MGRVGVEGWANLKNLSYFDIFQKQLESFVFTKFNFVSTALAKIFVFLHLTSSLDASLAIDLIQKLVKLYTLNSILQSIFAFVGVDFIDFVTVFKNISRTWRSLILSIIDSLGRWRSLA